MTELPINPLQKAEKPSRFAISAAGQLFLSILFIASASGVYAYLSDESLAAAQTQAANAALAAQESEKAAAAQTFSAVALQAEGALVVDDTTHVILFSRNPAAQLPLASLTKVPLVLAVSEALPPTSVMTLVHPVVGSGTTQGIPAGTSWETKDLIDFTLVGSSNDGAQALADAADESLRARYPHAPKGTAAIWLMNKLMHDLGLSHTYFLNPTGLDESATLSGAYGSAADVASIFSYAASTSPGLFRATSLKSVTITATDGRTAVAENTDEALDDIPGLVMGKTGYTDLAGGNLAVVADLAPGHRIIAVVLGSTFDGRFSDMRELIAAAQATLAH